MKFAFDVDGVITEAPRFFAEVTRALRKAGHHIAIVTDFDEHFRSYREQELRDYGIDYDELVITGEKESFCRENGFSFAVDDDSDYFLVSKTTPLLVAEIKPE